MQQLVVCVRLLPLMKYPDNSTCLRSSSVCIHTYLLTIALDLFIGDTQSMDQVGADK